MGAGAGGVELGDLRQLLRRDADRVEDVGDAVGGEILGFGEGRDGDAAGLSGQRQARHLDRLRGLHVRAQRHALGGQRLGHAGDVAQQDRPVEHEAGRRQVGEVHPRSSAMRGVAFSPEPVSTSTVR
jgi:hypothetical protein